MATSFLGRLFGRGRDDTAADTAPPEYTGVGAARGYDPPPGAPGHDTLHRGQSPRSRYEEAVRERKVAEHQVKEFERYDAKLTQQLHEATEAERTDYVRELLSRQRAVRARLEEATLRRNRLVRTEQELGAARPAPPALDAPSGPWR
jgi:hypothetical protein